MHTQGVFEVQQSACHRGVGRPAVSPYRDHGFARNLRRSPSTHKSKRAEEKAKKEPSGWALHKVALAYALDPKSKQKKKRRCPG